MVETAWNPFLFQYEEFYSLCDVNQGAFYSVWWEMRKEQGFVVLVFALTEAYRGGWEEFPVGLFWRENFGKLSDWEGHTGVHNFSSFLACGTSTDPVRPNLNISSLGSFP